MKTSRQNVLLAVSPLLLGAFLLRPVSASSDPYENLRTQNPIINLNLTAVLNHNSLDIPAIPVPAPVVEGDGSVLAVGPLPDFAQVTPALYRAGQPTQEGIAKIKGLGVKTILKLNADNQEESNWAASAGLVLETLAMSNMQSPTYKQVDAALAVINDTSKQPILVHCYLGHDRTGTVIGAYRVTVQGWSIDQAAAEAKSMGYGSPFFQDITTYLQGYVAHTHHVAAWLPAPSGRVVQPDWSLTPGRLCTPSDPNFKEYRYSEHIAYCNRNVTQQMKQQVAAEYSVPESNWSNYEFDHLIPLCIGGNSSVDNIWPQPHGANESDGKNKLENDLYNQMAAGTITQRAAKQQIYDWFKRYADKHREMNKTSLAAAF